MDLLHLTLATAEENLALDEALLLEAEAGRIGEVLRFWELGRHAVVLGASGRLSEEVNEEGCSKDGVPIVRRPSGGGTVLIGPGCLCFSLVLSLDRSGLHDVTHSYRVILGRVAESLADQRVEPAGSSDLAIAERKISGNSQRRLKRRLLHHGTILHAMPPEVMERYLFLPARQPEYRRQRSHEGFVRNLSLSREEIQRRLAKAWSAEEARIDVPLELVRRLVVEKYSVKEWTYRR